MSVSNGHRRTPIVAELQLPTHAPANWQWVRLTDVAKLESGHTPSRNVPSYWDGDIKWLSLKDIRGLDGKYIAETSDHPTALGIDNSSARVLPKGTVALCRTASVGKSVILGCDMATSQDFVNWVCGPKLLPEYLYYSFRNSEAEFDRLQQGTTHKTIYMPIAEQFAILLPPLPEQRRIAAILDKADAIRRKREEVIRVTDELLRSIFLEMFGDSVQNPNGWPMRTIGDLTEVKTGATPSRDDSNNFGGTIPWVKTSEVDGEVITDTEEKLTQIGFDSARGELYPIGSLLVALYGQGATRGRTAILGIPATTNQACAVILPSNKYSTRFLWSYLKLSYHRLRDQGRGGNQPNLNLGMIRAFPVPLPPMPLQQVFERIANAIIEISVVRKKAANESDFLFGSLVQRAFKGELTNGGGK